MATTSRAPAAKAATTSKPVLRPFSTRSSRLSISVSLSRTSDACRKRCIASEAGTRSFDTTGTLTVDSRGFGGRAVVAVLGFSRNLAMISSGGISFARSWATERSVSTSPGVSRRSSPWAGFAPSLKNSAYARHQERSVLGGTPICLDALAGGKVSVGIRYTGSEGTG